MKKLLALLLLASPMLAQTIAPKDIKPGNNGDVMTTTGGKTGWNPGATAVSSVFGRTGVILPVAGDYDCSKVTGAICSLPALFNQTVKVDGAPQTQRPALNFINGTAGTVSCIDNPVTSSTDCTFTGGANAGITYSIADVTGSRSVNVAYQNTTSAPMFIGGSIGTQGSGVGNVTVAQGLTSTSLPFVSWANEATATQEGGDAGFSATIMPGYWYTVRVAGYVNRGVRYWTQITSTGSGGGGGGTAGVTSLNAAGSSPLTGALVVACDPSFCSATQSGNTITIGAPAPPPVTYRSYGGLGTAGATSTVTTSGTTATLSTGDVLATVSTSSSNVGESYGPYSPSGQNIYLLIYGGSHTFLDTGSGFPFSMNAPTAVTVNGQSMFLYQSANPLYVGSTPFTIKVQ